MPEEKKITIVEVKADGTSSERVEAPVKKVKAETLSLTPDAVVALIKKKQEKTP